jgi:hypothetical protein
VLFLLDIVLSVILRYTDHDYPFGIFKLFLNQTLFWLSNISTLNVPDEGYFRKRVMHTNFDVYIFILAILFWSFL